MSKSSNVVLMYLLECVLQWVGIEIYPLFSCKEKCKMEEFQYQKIFHPQMPPEVLERGKRNVQIDVFYLLLPELFDGKNRIFTVQGFEETKVVPDGYSYTGLTEYIPGTHYKVTLKVGRVETHQVHIETFEEMSWNRVYRSATQEVKYRVKNKIKNFFSRLGGKQ